MQLIVGEVDLDLSTGVNTEARRGVTSCGPSRRHVKTLVLDLDDVLVHSDWSRERGWRTFKRPGAEDFLRTMSQYYEVGVSFRREGYKRQEQVRRVSRSPSAWLCVLLRSQYPCWLAAIPVLAVSV